MSLPLLLDAFDRSAAGRDLAARLPGRGASLDVGGLPGSSAAVLAAALVRSSSQRLMAIVAPTPADAERWLSDLQFLSDEAVALYPQREALGEDEPHYEIAGERVETIEALLGGRLRIVVTTARAIAERTLVPSSLEKRRLRLAKGTRIRPQVLVQDLEAMGFSRVTTVTEVAEFSARGGIVDIYGFGMASATRLEWWDDEVSSLRAFDLTTQRSGVEIDEITVLPIKAVELGDAAKDAAAGDVRRTLLDLLPSDSLLLLDTPGPIEDEIDRAWREAAHHLEIARRLGENVPEREEILEAPPAVRARMKALPTLRLVGEGAQLQFGFLPPEKIDRQVNRLRDLLHRPPDTLILCDNEGQIERLDELLEERGNLPAHATLVVGALDGGFLMPGLRVLTDHEIFRRARRLRRARRYRQAAPSAATGALVKGDYVVHLDHGIGIYRGIETITVGASTMEVAVVEYEGGDRLNVPLYRLDQLERYRSAEDDGDRPPPRIHSLGGSHWKKVREKAQQGIRQMAGELLDLYARRKLATGYAFPPDTRWQRELESSFLYEDTPDQRKATDDIKRDLEQARPMDRLLVGDVGYGKTEIAVRAAFKAVQGGKQVAVLVPTTILAEQHGRTFTERLADYPVKIEVLSRFRTAKEQKAALGAARPGRNRHHHRHAPPAFVRRQLQGPRASSWWTRSTGSG